MRRVHGLFGAGQLGALVHDELPEVVGEVATERLLELSDLLRWVAVGCQRGDVLVVEEPQSLHSQQPTADQWKQVDADLTVGDGDPV